MNGMNETKARIGTDLTHARATMLGSTRNTKRKESGYIHEKHGVDWPVTYPKYQDIFM